MRALSVLSLILLAVTAPDGVSQASRTLHVASDGIPDAGCTQDSPCDSFDRAYRMARPGDTVLIEGGIYPPQLIRVDRRKLLASQAVVFQPAGDGTVIVDGDLTMQGSHAVFRGGRRIDGSYTFQARRVLSSIGSSLATVSSHVTFRNLKAETFAITGTRFITFQGGDYGPSVACWPRGTTGIGPLGGEITPLMWCPIGSGYEVTGNTSGTEPRIGPSGAIKRSWPRNILLDGVTVHDQNSLDHVNMHSGGLFLVSGRGLRIQNSLFYGNIVYDIFAQDFTTPDCCGMTFGPFRDVVLINNRFRAPVNAALQAGGNGWTSQVKNEFPEIQLDPRNDRTWENWRIERNSFENGILFDGRPTFRRVEIACNIGGSGECYPGVPDFLWVQNAMKSQCGSFAVPFGYALKDGALRRAGEAVGTVRSIFVSAASGTDAAAIARMLRRSGRPAAQGAWTSDSVRAIVRNRLYLGGLVGPPGSHPGLVSSRVWKRAQRAIR